MDRDKGQAVKRVDTLLEVRDCGITWQFDKPSIQTLLIMNLTPWVIYVRAAHLLLSPPTNSHLTPCIIV